MKKLLWIDLEMTGLDVETNVVIEMAAIVTDYSFKELDTLHCVIRPDKKYIDQMDDWNKKTHSETGLLDAIAKNGVPAHEAETRFMQFMEKHFNDDRPIIAGNSVGHDRKFLAKYYKKIADRLHYRTLDVTSWKIVLKDIYGIEYDKIGTHRAVDDIRESIEELKYYLKFFNLPTKANKS